jgi:hypothetical protein
MRLECGNNFDDCYDSRFDIGMEINIGKSFIIRLVYRYIILFINLYKLKYITMETKEALEAEKLRIEIAQLKEPYWKKPGTMISTATVIITAIIGFSSYFVKVNQENVSKIKELELKIKENAGLSQKIEVENLNLQKTQIEIEARENRTRYEQSKQELIQVGKEIDKKSKALDAVRVELGAAKDKYAQNKQMLDKQIADKSRALNALSLDLVNSKNTYNQYKEKVKNVVKYMADYGPEYARGVLSSPSGKLKISEIAAMPVMEERIKEIDKFSMNIVRQTFVRYISKKEGELEILSQPATQLNSFQH